MKLRVKFRKFGPVRFIGHLDVMRYFQKAVRRAELDIVYTSGFSPHQVMSFAAPLGVGLESNGEYMDIEVNSVTDSLDMIQRLNAAGVAGIEVVSVKLLPEKAENAMASVAAAEYMVDFQKGHEPAFDYKSKTAEFMEQEHIIIQKVTKKGTREVDLKTGIYHFDYMDGAFHMLVDASSAGNIKPSMVMEAYLLWGGEALQENSLLITRQDTYTDIGSPEEPKLVPLDAIGSVIN